MKVITGGAGFIGSGLVATLNNQNIDDIIIVDWLGQEGKWQNLSGASFEMVLEPEDFMNWASDEANAQSIEYILHMGACSDTTEADADYLNQNNTLFSISLAQLAKHHDFPLIYASSAATYGNGDRGFSDDPSQTKKYQPLNAYGFSKHAFDQWMSKPKNSPKKWAGFKFFNVYGPGETFKGPMTSMVSQCYQQASTKKLIRLFKSHHPDFADGEQRRDFIYIKDVVDSVLFAANSVSEQNSGVYNLGSGEASSFNQIAESIFDAAKLEKKIEYFDMPEHIRDKYQYLTEAPLDRLRENLGYKAEMTSLNDGIKDYVENYLLKDKISLF